MYPYGPPNQYGPPPPGQYGQQGYPYPQGAVIIANAKSPGLAAGLELLGGFFFQTFGIGHLYAGNVGVGLAFMFGYWFITAINVFLCFLIIGLFTWPLCWIAAMVLSSITASNAAKEANQRLAAGRPYY